MVKPIKVDLPYPSLNGICEDGCAARIISPAYAGLHGELTAILQYIYHTFYFQKECFEETADILSGIAVTEMEHFDILGEMLLKLGTDPVFSAYPPQKYNFFNASTVSYSKTPQKMLMDNISGEMLAVEEYSLMLSRLENECVAAVISRIRLDEELHIKVLKAQLEKLSAKNNDCCR